MCKETDPQIGRVSLKVPLLSPASLSPYLAEPVCLVVPFLNLGAFVLEAGPSACGHLRYKASSPVLMDCGEATGDSWGQL